MLQTEPLFFEGLCFFYAKISLKMKKGPVMIRLYVCKENTRRKFFERFVRWRRKMA